MTLAASLALVACGSSDETGADVAATTPTTTLVAPAAEESVQTDAAGQRFPDVIDVEATQDGATWTFAVTVSSPYDTPERYADGWRIVSPDGTELGFRLLTHDHASEQPFTRSLDGVAIPDDVDVVTVEGRDQANGFGGETFELTLAR